MKLRAAHEKDGLWMGVNIITGDASDMLEAGVVEPLRVKKQAIVSASEAAEMILRIDDVIASKSHPAPEAGPGGMPGRGGMPPGMPPGMGMM